MALPTHLPAIGTLPHPILGRIPKEWIQIKFRRGADGDFCKIRVMWVKDKIAFDSDDGAWR